MLTHSVSPVRVALLLSLLGGYACSPTGGLSDGKGSMSASIDGERWRAGISVPGLPSSAAMAVSASERSAGGKMYLSVTGTKTDGSTGSGISLSISSAEGFALGDYTITGSSGSEADAQLELDQDQLDATTGTVTLTDYDEQHVTGTFEFTASDRSGMRSEVTEGRFDAEIMRY